MEKWRKISETSIKDNHRKLARRVFILPDHRRIDYDVLLEDDTACVLAFTTDQKISVSATINGTGSNIENISIK